MSKKKLKKKAFFGKVNKYFYLILAVFVLLITTPLLSKNSNSLTCANSISCIKDLKGIPQKNAQTGIFMEKKVKVPKIVFEEKPNSVLGSESTNTTKHIFVDLTAQKLYAVENERRVMEFSISSGKWGKTPTGDFTTWIKLKATRMKGGDKDNGTYYDLPNVPYTMFFYNNDVPKSLGYGIHGAYWHNNFGHPMSHGCINLSVDDSKTLYDWANPPSVGFTTYVDDKNPGTPVTIYGIAPLN